MPLIPFATKSSGNAGYSGERLVNWFIRPTDGVSQGTLLGRGGGKPVVSLGGPVRAVFEFKEKLHAIADGKIYRIEGTTVTTIGTVNGSENVSVAVNSNEFAAVIGNRYYVSDGDTTSEVSTGAVEVPTGLTFIRGYMVPVGSGAGRGDMLTVSGLDDASTFDSFDFAFAESATDGLVAAIEVRDQLWLFGKNSIEVWYLSGDADFPLTPTLGRTIDRGTLYPQTIAEEDNAVFWVGNDKIVYRGTGSSPAVISTREIEDQIRDGEVHSALTFEERGHKFYAIRMKNGPSLVYDLTTQLWHERTTGTDDAAWFITCGTRVNGKQYFGTDTGKIVTLDEDTFTDDGDTIVAEAVSSPIYRADGLRIARVHAQVSGGTYLDRTPEIMLQTSADGRNWSPEQWRDLGGLGEYSKSAEWHGMGRFERFQCRIRISDPVRRDVHGVKYDAR